MDSILALINIDLNVDARRAVYTECDLDVRDCEKKTHDELLEIARSRINVFPYSSVKSCWFKLYTDASILKAAGFLMKLEYETDFESERSEQLLSKAIAALDYALIVAGGGDEKRKRLIQKVFVLLETLIVNQGTENEDEAPPTKRRRLDIPRSDTRHKQGHRQLPNGKCPTPHLKHPIRILRSPSLRTFESWAHKSHEPVVLQGALDHWPALAKWKNVKYWWYKTLHGHRLVPVEIGQSYNDEDWRQEIMPFRQFLEGYILINDNAEQYEVGYLAQHDLFRQIEGIRADVAVPDYCYCDMPKDEAMAKRHDLFTTKQETSAIEDEEDDDIQPEIHQNVWFGGRTVSPLHHDPYHNILCQVHGTKYIRLYSPEHTSNLYPKSKTEPAPHLQSKAGPASGPINEVQLHDDSTTTGQGGDQRDSISIITQANSVDTSDNQPGTIDMSNNSSVDILAMQLSPDEDWDEKWPGISSVPYFECLLEAGEALFIPKGWWHYVRSLSASGISVSFWW
ncbi:hypothetical protein LTS08_000725 [Lithohypha guttulata]|nr:hypothetical protein LTS08_000725 [Lithohypha guttulata]